MILMADVCGTSGVLKISNVATVHKLDMVTTYPKSIYKGMKC